MPLAASTNRQGWRPDERALETMILVRRAITERAEQALPPTTGARSAARPACSDGFENVDGCPECGVYIEVRRGRQGLPLSG
jgi:hypothetical protein